jgi:hypothetical protein
LTVHAVVPGLAVPIVPVVAALGNLPNLAVAVVVPAEASATPRR